MNITAILSAARLGNPAPARNALSACNDEPRTVKSRRREYCARIAEAVALNDYAAARNIGRDAMNAGLELPKCCKF